MFWYYRSWSQSTTWMRYNNSRTYKIIYTLHIYGCHCIDDAAQPPPPPIHVPVIKEVSRHLLWQCNRIVLTRNVHMSWGTLFQIWGPICRIICVDASVCLFYLQLVWIELNVHEQWHKQQTPTCVVVICNYCVCCALWILAAIKTQCTCNETSIIKIQTKNS